MCVKECTQNWVMKVRVNSTAVQTESWSRSFWQPCQTSSGQNMFSCFRQKPCFHLLFYLFSVGKAICEPLSAEHLHSQTGNSEYSHNVLFRLQHVNSTCLSQQQSHHRDVFTQLRQCLTTQCFAATGRVSNYGYLSEKLPSWCLNENAITPEHLLISYSNYIDSTLLVTRGHHGSDGQYSENGVGCGKAVRVRL